ncbi:MAG: glycosyltransferase family 39 protein [Gemmatimonadetes bacterium]|nr:glycosyltransferase family 39 protein [Gemmatimonadota bacterium]
MPTDPGAAEVAPTRAEGVALALIIGCAIVLRATFLAQPVRYDEAVTIMAYAREPLVTAASLYDAPNNHVFNSVLAHLASRVAGDTLWAYRLPVFVAGILTVPATWLAGRRLFGPEAGLLGAALAASNFALVLFSTNSRGYAIQTLLFVLLVAASLTLFETRRWRPWLAFGVVGALGFYTIPTMLMGWGGLMLWFLLESAVTRRGWPERALVVRLAITNGVLTVLTLALYAPVFIVSGWRALTQNPWVTPITAGAVVRGAPRMVAETLGSWTTDLPRTAVGLLAIGLVCSLVWPRDTGDVAARPTLARGVLRRGNGGHARRRAGDAVAGPAPAAR